MDSPNSLSILRKPGLTFFDAAICLYLAFPTFIFFTWFKTPFAVGFAVLFGYGIYRALAGTNWRRIELPRSTLVLLALLAVGWVFLSGVGHFVYANLDWFTRDAVLRDLSQSRWPPAYPTTSPEPLILRAPIAYFLPASVVGGWSTIQAADSALYVWTALGFFLLLGAALSSFETTRQRIICAAVILGFSGMDLAGYALTRGILPALGEHIEWWAGFAQYSANSTLLFWVPNHALPGWLVTILILRQWRQAELAKIAPLLGSCVPLWSPLAALGTMPFFLAGIDWRRDFRTLISLRNTLPLAVVALVSARYLTIGADHIPGSWLMNNSDGTGLILYFYLMLCLLEFGLLCLLLVRLHAYNVKVAIAVIILCLLPLYRFGYGNDMVMRGSIPALFVLAIAVVRPLTSPGPIVWRGTLAAILLIGGLGALQEPIRAFLTPRWTPTGMSLLEVSERVSAERGEAALPSTYVAHLGQPDLLLLMRPSSMVSGATRNDEIEAPSSARNKPTIQGQAPD